MIGNWIPVAIGGVLATVAVIAIYIGDIWQAIKTGTLAIAEWIGALPAKIGEWFSSLPESISEFFSNISETIENVDWEQLDYDIAYWIGSGIADIVTWVEEAWENVKQWFSELPSKLEQAWEATKQWFKDLPETIWETIVDSYDWIKNATEWFLEVGEACIDGLIEAWDSIGIAVEKFLSGLIDGIKEGLGIHSPSTVFQDIASDCLDGLLSDSVWGKALTWFEENVIQPIQDTFSSMDLEIKLPHFSWSTTPATGWAKTVLEALGLPASLPKLNVSWYASGGFPNMGELFVAREAGPELVGSIGNRSAVANNDQIVEAVSKGVYSAVVAAMGQTQSNNPSVQVFSDGKEITASVEKHQSERGRTILGNRMV